MCKILHMEGDLEMSVFTAKKLKETREKRNYSQEEVANRMKMSRRKLISIEANEAQISSDEILEFAKLYKVDIRELLLEEYAESGEEQILSNRYISFLRLFDQLSDKDKEDLVWVVKQRLKGAI